MAGTLNLLSSITLVWPVNMSLRLCGLSRLPAVSSHDEGAIGFAIVVSLHAHPYHLRFGLLTSSFDALSPNLKLQPASAEGDAISLDLYISPAAVLTHDLVIGQLYSIGIHVS